MWSIGLCTDLQYNVFAWLHPPERLPSRASNQWAPVLLSVLDHFLDALCPKDSVQNECPSSTRCVEKSKQRLGVVSERNFVLLRSSEDRITGKGLKSGSDKVSINEEPNLCNKNDGNIGLTGINNVEMKSEVLSEVNAPKISNLAPLFSEKQCGVPTAYNFNLPSVERDPSIDEPLALNKIKPEPLDVKFDSINVVEQNSEPKSKVISPISEFPAPNILFNAADLLVHARDSHAVQSQEIPVPELVGFKLHEGLPSLEAYGQACSEHFSSPEDLNKQTENLQNKCNVCQSVFSSQGYLMQHLKIHNEDLEKYSVMHLGKLSYKCNVCQQVFSNPRFLKRHLTIHTGIGINKCETCNKTFIRKGALKIHEKIHIGEFSCEVCKKCFISSQMLQIHLTVHTVDKKHKCEMCHRTFRRKFVLKIHKRSHSGEKPFGCQMCQRSFSSSGALRQHSRIHTGERPYKCGVCSSDFMHLRDLKAHTRNHTGEKPFNCELCNMCFKTHYTLKIHLMVHTRERPHNCKLCGKGFRTSTMLRQHVALHSTVKPHICKICNKGFIFACRLKFHLLTHTEDKPFKCEVCGKGFCVAFLLNKHTKTHTSTNSLKCEICHRVFRYINGLRAHAKIHRLEKRFVCEVCSKGFNRPDDLEAHYSIHIEQTR